MPGGPASAAPRSSMQRRRSCMPRVSLAPSLTPSYYTECCFSIARVRRLDVDSRCAGLSDDVVCSAPSKRGLAFPVLSQSPYPHADPDADKSRMYITWYISSLSRRQPGTFVMPIHSSAARLTAALPPRAVRAYRCLRSLKSISSSQSQLSLDTLMKLTCSASARAAGPSCRSRRPGPPSAGPSPAPPPGASPPLRGSGAGASSAGRPCARPQMS